MHVSELWRYPIKSLKGEKLEQAEITPLGIPGDREIIVRSESGRLFTSRAKPKLLGLRGELGTNGVATINGHLWDSPEAVALVSAAAGEPARLEQVPQPYGFDILPLLIATDGTVKAINIDQRRLRPNILVSGVNRLDERNWVGDIIAIGDVRIKAVKLRERCVMTTYDPDTQVQDRSVLLRIVREFDGVAALDCSVIEPGTIHVGDAVEIL
jgi:MOSC domain-containing protein